VLAPHTGRRSIAAGTRAVAVGSVVLIIIHDAGRMVCAEGQLTADELNSLIAHAHRRIEQLEKQLAGQQTAEQQRVNVALSQLRDENELLAEQRLVREKEQMQAELETLKRHWVLLLSATTTNTTSTK